METWGNFEFWFVWFNQIMAFATALYFISDKHPKRNLLLMAAVNFSPAISLIFFIKLMSLWSLALMLIGFWSVFSMIFVTFFFKDEELQNHKIALEISVIAPLLNSVAALFFVGASKVLGWQVCATLGIVAVVFCLFSHWVYKHKRE